MDETEVGKKRLTNRKFFALIAVCILKSAMASARAAKEKKEQPKKGLRNE